MDVRELSIGNWVNGDELGKCVVNSVFASGQVELKSTNNNFIVNSIDINPIPLTEEILLKCEFNFEKLGFNDLSVGYGLSSKRVHFVIDRYCVKLEYLHQLQNLYHSLCGKELDINLALTGKELEVEL